MKKLSLILFLSSSIFADQKLIIDPDFSPYTGANDLLFAHSLLVCGEDWLVAGSYPESTTKTWGRAIEQLFIWSPLNTLTNITQHEVFGHGYRLRELDIKIEKYSITLTGGYTRFQLEPSLSIGKLQAITVAGLESQNILAQSIKWNWIASGCIDGRLSSLYSEAHLSTFFYSLSTRLGELKGTEADPGNDVNSYVTVLNASYPNDKTSVSKLLHLSILNFVDPMLFYSWFSWFYYIAEGTPLSFPMIPLSDEICYLPNLRMGFAPYAPEVYFENYFLISNCPLYVYAKGGKRSFGAGFIYDDLYCADWGKIGIRFDGWRQKKFITSATVEDFFEEQPIPRSKLTDIRWGFASSLTGTLNLFSSCRGIYAELGGKTKGYLPGYALGGSIVARVGLSFKY